MAANKKFKLLIHSARQLVQVCSKGEKVLRGVDMSHVAILESKESEGDTLSGISVVVDRDGKIADIGNDEEIIFKYKNEVFDTQVDASGMCILPGFIDAHTHPVWDGDRVHEFAMKLAGATYMEVHAAGGGIHYTVDHTQEASEEKLLMLFIQRLHCMLQAGTTLIEAKSGYGLDAENEIKLLRVIERAKFVQPIEISSTYCGAHAVPKGMTSQQATDDIISDQLPRIKDLMNKGSLCVDNIDVFCEKGVFEVEESKKILQAGQLLGLRVNFHAEELHCIHGAEMGAKLGAEAISHLEEICEAGIQAMAKAGTIAVILPTTQYILRLRPPPVRQMIEAGIPIALGTDFNPNAYCLSMPLTMHLACVNFRMSMPEALVASTINAAAALGKSLTHGSIEIGKFADMVVIEAPRWEHIVYQLGGHDQLIKVVIKHGNVVHKRTQ
ncbi:probable imidazolonepropionase [Limulus polyphemus]|uniref:Probable imidazolonepropionase n=1 Tax=Limulus polyphemus TaxID=6850 RepID=A0ABM1C423_LIMPO|nr:probable imidazolonepropionase [Limulus polyphemus]